MQPEWDEYLVTARTRLNELSALQLTVERQSEVPAAVFQAVKDIVQAQVTALDSTARIIGSAVLNRDVKRLPYYPKVKNPTSFAVSLQSQLPGLAKAHPDIAEAYERHQPYQKGRRYLALLFELAAVRKATNLPLEVREADADAAQQNSGDIYLAGPTYATIEIPAVAALERIQDLVEQAVEDVTVSAGIDSAGSRFDRDTVRTATAS
ncbi:hypothetical protein D1871_10795 [Nakamurella silvestris]|nr:hypothetical protein D1871_10795 [Nakamurella silvestris]